MFKSHPFFTCAWRHLVMLNYEIDQEKLSSYLPKGMQADLFGDTCLVSLVAFTFSDLKVFGIPAVGFQDFAQINLRMYVRCSQDDEVESGVTFIRELCPHAFISWSAAITFNENYLTVPTNYSVERSFRGNVEKVQYEWSVNTKLHRLQVQVQAPFSYPAENSVEDFIVNRNRGFTPQRDGSTRRFSVAHPAWKVASVAVSRFEWDPRELYGDELGAFLVEVPHSAFIVDGSEVGVFYGERVWL